MTANLQQADGTLETSGGRDVLRYERRLSHPVERVWRAITEPEEIVQWLGEAELEPVEGGTVVLRWLNTPEQTIARGTVTAFDPPRALELDTDIHGTLRWELEADGDACRLTFTASYPEKDEETRLSLLAGWHIHLDHLADALEGRAQDWPRWMDEQLPRWTGTRLASQTDRGLASWADGARARHPPARGRPATISAKLALERNPAAIPTANTITSWMTFVPTSARTRR